MPEEIGGGGGYEAGSVYIGIEADTSPLDNLTEQIAAKVSGIGAISVPFDHEPLRAGNAHIESKFTHVIDVNRRLTQYAIKPLYDGSAIEQLSSDLRSLQAQIDLVQTKIQLEATLNADAVRSQLDEIASQPRVIRYVTEVQGPDPQSIYGTGQSKAQAKPSVEGLGDAIAPELKKAFKDASKEFNKGNIFGGIASFVTAPLRAVGSLATEAIGGAVFGAGQQLTSGFAKGLTNSLSGKLAGSVGSPELLGEKSGDLIASFAGFARKSIVNKAKEANVAIDKTIEVGTLEFGNFSIPLDILGINKADLRTFKEELTTAARTSVEEYLEEFEQIFPEVQRQAEAAAQRNKVRRRRQSVEKVAPQQIIDENQEAIQQLTRQRARGNTLLVNKSVEAEAIRDEVRVNRREAAQILKQIIRAETNGEIREQLIRLAAEDIPARFQGQINKLQRAYGETLEKINQKNAEIARDESESALLGIKPNPEIKSQKLDDIQRLRAQAEKQQQDIRLQESIVQQEVEQYLSAATGEIDFAPILADLKNQAIEQIKSLGEPLLQVKREKAEIQQALRSVNTEISRLTEENFTVSSPSGKRLILQKRLEKQQKSFTAVQGEITDTQAVNESLLNQGSFSRKDADLFTFNINKISELEKKQQRTQKQISKTQADLKSIPGASSQPVRDIFKEIFSELGFKGKEPEVIVDTVAVSKKGANAYFDTAANAVIIKADLSDAINQGKKLTDFQKDVLREEIIHSVQLDNGSAKALENIADAYMSGGQLPSVTKASTPTPAESRRLASELEAYQNTGRGQELDLELEAKVLRDRLAAREKEQATINRITQELNTKAGFSGAALDSAYTKYLSQFLSEVKAIKQIEGIDASEPINRYIDIVSVLSDSSKQYLEQLARLNLGQVDAAEAIQIESAFDKQVEDISNIYRAKESLVQEIQQLTQRKSEALVFPERADAELVPVQRQERQTVGGAISAVTSGVIVPTVQRAGNAVVAVGKAGHKAAEALEALVLDLIPAGRSLKATTKFAAKNIALPTGAAIAASQIPAIGGLEQVAISAAGDLVHQLVGLTRTGILSQVQSIVSAAVPSFIPGSQNIVSIVSERIAALATGALDATGTATAEGLATVLSGSAVLNVLKKGVNTGIAQASRALPAAGQAILDTPQAQAIANAQIPFELPTRDRVLEVANDAGAIAREAEDKTIQFAENTLKGLKLLTQKLPIGTELIDLGLDELQAIKLKLAARFDEVAQAEREGKPVLAGRDVVRGDIKRVQRVIDAKSQAVIETPPNGDVQDELKKLYAAKRQAESKYSQDKDWGGDVARSKKAIDEINAQIKKLESVKVPQVRDDIKRVQQVIDAKSQPEIEVPRPTRIEIPEIKYKVPTDDIQVKNNDLQVNLPPIQNYSFVSELLNDVENVKDYIAAQLKELTSAVFIEDASIGISSASEISDLSKEARETIAQLESTLQGRGEAASIALGEKVKAVKEAISDIENESQKELEKLEKIIRKQISFSSDTREDQEKGITRQSPLSKEGFSLVHRYEDLQYLEKTLKEGTESGERNREYNIQKTGNPDVYFTSLHPKDREEFGVGAYGSIGLRLNPIKEILDDLTVTLGHFAPDDPRSAEFYSPKEIGITKPSFLYPDGFVEAQLVGKKDIRNAIAEIFIDTTPGRNDITGKPLPPVSEEDIARARALAKELNVVFTILEARGKDFDINPKSPSYKITREDFSQNDNIGVRREYQAIDPRSQAITEAIQPIENPQAIRISKAQYENDLKKVIQAESKQIEKLRSQLIENLRQGSTSDALQIAEQLKTNSKSVLAKLESFKSNTNLDLEPAIRKSVNGYITRFKDLIAQTENATAKIANDEDFSSLLSINTQQIAENFTGLINNLFEVEGKNLEDALKKAAVSPRAKDLYVNTAGFAASQVGAQLGSVPQLAGDLGGALVARQAINIGEQAIAARSELLEDELYQSANAIKKLKMVAQKTAERLQSVELQNILGSNLSEDVAGFSIGNIAAALGQGAVPGVGAVAAMATVPKLSELRRYINERIAASQGDGEEDLGILKSISNEPLYGDKDIEILKRLADELAEIERLTKQIEAGQERIRKIEADTTNLEQKNRRNLRFDTVGQDRNQRAAAQEVERIKARNKAEADAEKERRDRLTQSDISSILSNAKPSPQPDRVAQAKLENERENVGRAQSSRTSQQSPVDRLAAIKAETEAQQESLTSRLESINAQRAAERNAANERLAEIQAEAEAQKKLEQDRLAQSLESQKAQGIRERLTASQQPRPKEDLTQYLTRVPGTAGGGNGPRVPGPPTLFIPEIQPRVTAFDVAKRAASGFLGVVEKIPAPIKNLFFLLGGGFAGFQAFQILTNQANQSYEAIKRLESARVVINFATGNTNALTTAEKQATLLGTKLTESREAIKSLAIQTKNTPLEQKIVPIFEGATTAAAALQLNPEQQSRLFLAFNQIAGKGTVQSEELKQQLGELGVSFQLAARAAGLTTTEFNKQLSQGAVLSQDFLPKFAAQLKLELGGAAISAGDSLQGLENKAGNAAQRLQEGLGQRSIPVISTGLKSLAGILDFAANNVQTLTNFINVALVAALIKGGQAFKAFAFEQQTFSTKDALGNITSISQSSRAGRFARGARDFVSGGGIQRALQSELAQDLKGLAVQTAAISAGIGAFQTIAEGFSGGERYQEFNKVLETTEKQIKAIESAERDRLNLAGKKEGRTSEQVRNDLAQTGAGAIGDLVSLDFKGFNKKVARNFQQLLGGDPTTALSDGLLATQEQADNRRILNNARDLLESKKFQEERNKAFSLAGQLKNNVKVNPDELKASRETIQSRLDVLKAVPEDLRKIRPEIDAEIKSLEKLQAALGGTGSAYSKLVKAAQTFENIVLKQIELDKLATSLDSSRSRANGYISEFEAKTAELEAQAKTAAKSKDEIKKLLDASNTFLASEEYAALKISDPEKAESELKRNLEFKSQFIRADKEIEDTITQQRLEGINRRSELLQREVSEQERAIAKLESLRRVRTTKRDAALAEGIADQSLTPQALRLQQPVNAVADAQDAIVEQEKKRQNALKNLKKARADLDQINPNDEQQFEQGKAAVAQYEQAVLAADAEINTQRKAASDAVTQYRSEIEDQIRTQIDLTIRKNEQAVTKEIQGIDRLGNAQKRRIDDAVAGYQREQKAIDFIINVLDRAAKVSNKRAELNSAINQGRQIPLAGLAGEIRDAEGLIAKLKDKNLDPAVRGRTQGVLNLLGISNNEQDAFRYRVKIEDQIAKLKADSLSAEIEQSQITLDIEERKETFAAKRAIIEAEITRQQAEQAALAAQIDRRKAESEVRKSDIGVQKATAQLQLAQLSGDPNKVKEAQLNLEDAKLSQSAAQDTLLGAKQSEKLAREALPNATLSVVDALENFASTIETGKLSRRILAATNQNKVSQFNTEERGRVRGLAIEGIDKGVEVNIASGSANGFDPFGFRASRAKDEMARQEDIRRFQNNIKGIPNGALPSRGLSGSIPGLNAPTYKAQEQKPLDFGGFGQSPQQAMDKAIEMAAMPINFAPVTDMLARLVQIEERLSAQILSLAGRQQVQVNNTANYAVREPVLRNTNL